MGRVAHSKSTKQTAPSNGARGSKIAKQRKNHKVVIESDSQDKEKSRAVLSFRADPPPGYTFIPAGNPQLTSALKEFAKRGNHQILAVTTTPHATRHELSREVHRIGFHFPTEVVSQVCNHYGIRLTSGGKLVEEKDDDKLFMRLYQKGQLVLDEKVRDQVTINTEAKQIIQDLFPNIPDNDLFQIIKTAFQLGDGKVGTADEIPLVRRAQLSVVAHIRHTYTNYDKLLRAVPYSEARHRVESITLQKLIDWRGDGKDDQQAMDDTLREVVVISDEEDSDEIEAGQLLENNDLRVQPVRKAMPPKPEAGGRPHSPIEVYSDDEAPRGYRYIPQVVSRYPVHDAASVSTARQQSRYAVWDRVRQEYRSALLPQPGRVVERIPIDQPQVVHSQGSYVTRDSLYEPESALRRVIEPPARNFTQPNQYMYTRGVDGKLYERVTTIPQPQMTTTATAPQRVYTPPAAEYGRHNYDLRQVSPQPQPPRMHRRTESFEYNDGTVLPSIESLNTINASPVTRRNPFEEPRPGMRSRNSGAYETNQRQAPLIDLTESAQQASKRRRIEDAPPSPYLIHPAVDRGREIALPNDENLRPSPRQLIPLENPAAEYQPQRPYERFEQRTQPAVIYRKEIQGHNMSSPRTTVVRQLPPSGINDVRYSQPSRRTEYVSDTDRMLPPSHRAVVPQNFSGYTTHVTGDRAARVVLQNMSLTDRPSVFPTEAAGRHIQTDIRNPFETSAQPRHYVQDLPDHNQREYSSVVIPQMMPPSRDARSVQYLPNDSNYQQVRMPQLPPTTVHR